MRVAFIGAFDPAYPRNVILREGLRAAGAQVTEVVVPERRALFRYPELAARLLAGAGDAEVWLVPEFRHKDVPLARLLAGKRLLVFDPLVSRWDTLVGDWELHARDSGQARWNRGIDRVALSAADLVLCDTWEHGTLFATLGADRTRIRRILVGAEHAFFSIGPAPAGPIRLLYLGGFLPLHGVPVILEAATLLAALRDLPAYVIELAGRGIEYNAVRAEAARRGLANLELTGSIPYAEAPSRFARSEIVLGAFGTTEKAGRVIPHKVYQGLAAGRVVITGDSPAIREVFTPATHLVTVPRGNPQALAEAIAQLLRDPERRRELGARGRARALEVATPEVLGRELHAAIAEALARR